MLDLVETIAVQLEIETFNSLLHTQPTDPIRRVER
jgi:hypothetical protein